MVAAWEAHTAGGITTSHAVSVDSVCLWIHSTEDFMSYRFCIAPKPPSTETADSFRIHRASLLMSILERRVSEDFATPFAAVVWIEFASDLMLRLVGLACKALAAMPAARLAIQATNFDVTLQLEFCAKNFTTMLTAAVIFGSRFGHGHPRERIPCSLVTVPCTHGLRWPILGAQAAKLGRDC